MILAPVEAVEIEMNKAPVGCDLPHVDHGIVDEAIRHVGPAGGHVVVAGAQVDGVEAVGGRNLVLVAIEDREGQLLRSVVGSEIHAHAAFGEVGNVTAKAFHPGIHLRVSGLEVDEFNGGLLLRAFHVTLEDQRDGRDRLERGRHLWAVARVLGDAGAHVGMVDNIGGEDVGLCVDVGGNHPRIESRGPQDSGLRNGDRHGVGEAGGGGGFGAIDGVANLCARSVGGNRDRDRGVVESAVE